MFKHGRPVADNRLAEHYPVRFQAQQVRQLRLPIVDWQSAQVTAIQFEKIEGDEDGIRLPLLAAQNKEVGVTVWPEDVADRMGRLLWC
jgi:hypothetical protein